MHRCVNSYMYCFDVVSSQPGSDDSCESLLASFPGSTPHTVLKPGECVWSGSEAKPLPHLFLHLSFVIACGSVASVTYHGVTDSCRLLWIASFDLFTAVTVLLFGWCS